MIIKTPIMIWKVIPITETKMQIIETVSDRVHLTPISVDFVSFSDQQCAPKPSFHSNCWLPVQAADWQSLAWCHSLRTRFPWSTKSARFRICWLTVKTLNDLLNFRTISDGSALLGQPTGLNAKSCSAVGNSRIFSCIFSIMPLMIGFNWLINVGQTSALFISFHIISCGNLKFRVHTMTDDRIVALVDMGKG